MNRRYVLKGIWVTPIVSIVAIPSHAQTSAPMASLLSEENGETTGCYEDQDAHLLPNQFDRYLLENISLSVEVRIASIKVGDPEVWNVNVGPLIIPAQHNLIISRGFHLPASTPLDYSGSSVEIIFIDGSVLSYPAISC